MFRSWGRIGTTIGNDKLEEVEDLNDAVTQFEALYEEKTGNRFSAKEFKKVPGLWYPLDIDYGQVSGKNYVQFLYYCHLFKALLFDPYRKLTQHDSSVL